MLRISGLVKTIATWNVRSLYEAGKVYNAIKEIRRLKIDILGISETHWPDQDIRKMEEYAIFYSSNNTNYHRKPEHLVSQVSQAEKCFVPLSEKVILVQLEA